MLRHINVGSGVSLSIRQLAEIIKKVLNMMEKLFLIEANQMVA